MAIMALEGLEVGMTLKSAVCDRSGRLLLPEGVELSEKHLKIFRTWGVTEADVVAEGNDESETGPLPISGDPALIAAAQAEVERLFIHNDPQHPLINELIRICVARKVTHAI